MDQKSVWVGTVILETQTPPGESNNKAQMKGLLGVLNKTVQQTQGNGVLLFNAGYLNTGNQKIGPSIYSPWSEEIKEALKKIKNRRIVICLGIDGRNGKTLNDGPPKDQIALAVDKTGVVAIGRKFHPIVEERHTSLLAKNYTALESGKSRIFSLNGKKFYLAVCYDVFGIKHKSLSNPGVDYVLNVIHKFTSRCHCEGDTCICGATAGDVYFAKNGLVGASKQWGSPVFGSVAFINRFIPPGWPSGVLWNKKYKHLRYWKYSDNPLRPNKEFWQSISQGRALIRVFDQNLSF